MIELFVTVIVGMVGHPWRVAAVLGASPGICMVVTHARIYRSDRVLAETTARSADTPAE